MSIGDNNVIAANSTITHSLQESNSIIGGNGKMAEVLKRNVTWHI